MQKRPRDTQRTRYYRAEKEFREAFDARLQSIGSCQSLVDRVQESLTWRRLLGRRGFREVPAVLVTDGRGRRSPCPYQGDDAWRIALPRHARTRLVVLRQLAFLATPTQYAWHGPEFVVALLTLVRRFMGTEAESALMGALTRQNVSRAGAVGDASGDLAVIRPGPPVPESATKTQPPPRPRDSQRARFYRAEATVRREIGRRFNTHESVVEYAFDVQLSNAWFALDDSRIWVDVGDGRGSPRARAFYEERRIELPVAFRDELAVLHQFAHLVTSRAFASHGPEFVGNLLYLIEAVVGRDAAKRFREELEAEGVREVNPPRRRAA
jgi:putative metallohydrolase (TIGR04338 family)